jgi:23S rRNA pseudouridine2604 synthase
MRLNKFISESGLCSRREADHLIETGQVTVNGLRAELGTQVRDGDDVRVRGRRVGEARKSTYLAFHKPVGVVCTTDKRDPDNIIDFIGYHERIFPIGRLDKDSEGLILLTNNGDIVNHILRAENHHEKEYVVTVDRPVTPDFLRGMASGVPILGTVTRRCQVRQNGRHGFRIILTQGLNRQIRRMCEYFGYEVLRLQRVRVVNVTLGSLKPGHYRPLAEVELKGLVGDPDDHARRTRPATRSRKSPDGSDSREALDS